MKSRVFLDSNIIIYLYSDDEPKKKQIISELLKSLDAVFISSQVLFEFVHITYRKLKLDYSSIDKALIEFYNSFSFSVITFDTLQQAIQIAVKYRYSFVDSLILASALENKCDILLTEDMHNEHIIENSLKIINPFIQKF